MRNMSALLPNLDGTDGSLYAKASKRLFFFDYDGTLAPIVAIPSMAIPSASALSALAQLSADPKNLVYIISGRDQEFLDEHLGHLNAIGFSAEHGGFLRERGQREWADNTANLDMQWMEEVMEIFEHYTQKTAGTHIERKKSAITWHYRASDPELAEMRCRQCHDALTSLANKYPFEVLRGKKNLEVRPIAINKGEIVKTILYENPDAEFIFCAGDDEPDEDMFRALLLFPPGSPAPTTFLSGSPSSRSVRLAVKPEAVFTTLVGDIRASLATWYVATPQELVKHILGLVSI